MVAIGPEINLFCPKLELFTSVRYNHEIDAKDRPEGHALTLTLTASDQLTFTPPTLHFDGSNWDVWQQVTVQAVDDPLIERTPHTPLLFHRIDSDDPAFQGRLGPTVSVDISDNDRAGLIFDELTAMTVTEDGTLVYGATESYCR